MYCNACSSNVYVMPIICADIGNFPPGALDILRCSWSEPLTNIDILCVRVCVCVFICCLVYSGLLDGEGSSTRYVKVSHETHLGVYMVREHEKVCRNQELRVRCGL